MTGQLFSPDRHWCVWPLRPGPYAFLSFILSSLSLTEYICLGICGSPMSQMRWSFSTPSRFLDKTVVVFRAR